MTFANMHDVLQAGAGSFVPAVFRSQKLKRIILDALDESGKWHRRKDCTLQAPIVLSSVLAMSIYRSESIADLFKGVLDGIRGDRDLSLNEITPEAFYHARARLGFEPLRLVALALGAQATPAHSFLGLIPCAVDGVTLALPDTPENEAEFGRPKASRGETAFPQMKGVGLVYTDTHQFRDFVWGKWNKSEFTGIEPLLAHLGSEHVVFLDRRYTKVGLWFNLLQRSIHFVHRLSGSYKPKRGERQGAGDWLIDVGRKVEIPLEERVGRRKWQCEFRRLRLIQYQVGENETVQLLTDLLDPVKYPAREIALGYHTRWEIEVTLDEVKTHLSTVCHGTQHTTFRSRKPNGIYQEAWGLVAAYNLLRGLMVDAGKKNGIPPLEISFVGALRVVRRAWMHVEVCGEGKRQRLLRRMVDDIADCRLDRPRRKRAAPRVVKVKMSNFKLKRKWHRTQFRDFAAELKLVEVSLAS